MSKRLFEKQIETKEIFKGKILGLYYDKVILPNEKIATREKVTHPGAVGIIPVTNDEKIILVKQYRYPVSEVTLEIPAGKLDRDEKPIATAERELKEEVGIINAELMLLSSFYTTPGFCDELLYLYLAKNFEITGNDLDDDEFLEIVNISLDDSLDLVKDGSIKDAKTIIGIIMAKDHLGR
jgi:ADP-ribose pyrophosphatase